jgi:ABC-type antimicrobial peptide transport system permease subunit
MKRAISMKRIIYILKTYQRQKTRIFFNVFAFILTMAALSFIMCTIFSIVESKKSIQMAEESKVLTMEFDDGPSYTKEADTGANNRFFSGIDLDNLKRYNLQIQTLPKYTNFVNIFRYYFLSQFPQINERFFKVYMVDPGYFEFFKIEPNKGRLFNINDLNQSNLIIINKQLEHYLFGQNSSKNSLKINDSEYQIIGTVDDYKKGFNFDLNAMKDELLTVYLLPPVGIYQNIMESILIKASSSAEAVLLTNSLTARLKAASNKGGRIIIHPFIENFNQVLNEFTKGAAVLLIFSLVLLIGTEIGLFGTFRLFNKERARSICIKMVFGGTPKDIIFEVLFEFLSISLAGSLIGIAFSSLLINSVNIIINPPMVIHNYLWINFSLLIVVSLLSLGLAIYPAYQAAQSRPAQVLHEL